MKHYLIFVCETVNSLPYIQIEQFLIKNHAIQIADNLFVLKSNNDKLRIDEVCFFVSLERKADVVIVEIDDVIMSWSFKDSVKEKKMINCFDV